MARALPRRSTLLASFALGLLAVAAEIAGIGAIQRLDIGRHVSTPGHAQADFYPPLLAPLLHTSALPVFAVLAVIVALAWRAVAGWLADYEHHARETLERGRRLVAGLVAAPVQRPMGVAASPVLRLLVSSLHQRPPPLLPA